MTYQYSVHFTEHLFEATNPLLANVIADENSRKASNVLVIVDEGILPHHPSLFSDIEQYGQSFSDTINLVAAPIQVPAGEASKNDEALITTLQEAVSDLGICRHSYIIGIGGGAVLDMVGYVAATSHRGIRLIRVPTTVLAQNDSGVGVKNSINSFGKKNFLGTFAPPYAVLNDATFLTTLDDRDWRSGMAEALKVALIKDQDFFHEIEALAPAIANRDLEAMTQTVHRCAELHMAHIANNGDPFEMGSSRPLDFGHWAAHRLEHLTQYDVRHGEAVAIGIVLDSTYSFLTGMLSESEWKRIYKVFLALGFELYIPELSSHLEQPEHPDSIFRGLVEFKEHLGGELHVMLLNAIGTGHEVQSVDFDRYREAIAILAELS